MKKTNSITRILCAALAFVTVLASAPFFTVEADATSADVYDFDGAYFDFESETVGKTPTKNKEGGIGAYKSNFVYGSSSARVSFVKDPTDENNIVIGKSSNSNNGEFHISDKDGLLLGSKLSVEARFYFASFTTSDTPFSIIAWNNGANKPMVRVSKTGEVDTGNCGSTSSYTSTGRSLKTNTWYTIRLDIDEAAHNFKLYIDNEYIATQTIADFTKSSYARFLYGSGTWEAYVDDIKFSFSYPNVSYDFEDASEGDTFDKAYLTKTFGLSGGDVTNMAFYQDPKDENNTVIGRSSTKTNGCFYIIDDNAALLNSIYSVDMKILVKTFPTKDTSNSGSPLSLFTWNNGNANIPLFRIMQDGTLLLATTNTPSSTSTLSNYLNTERKLSGDTWYDISLVINALGNYIELYVDGEFVADSTLPSFTKSPKIRFLQANGVWEIYLDDISIKKDTYVISEIDSFMNFEDLDVDKDITNADLSRAVFPIYAKTSSAAPMKTVADPENPNNTVSYNTGDGYYFSIHDNDLRLYNTDFVVGADFRFEEFPTVAADGSYTNNLLFSWVNGSSPNYHFFCRVDSNGYLLDGKENLTTFKFEKDKWYNVTVHCDGTSGEYDVYVDGEYIVTGDVGTPSSAKQSYIRVMYHASNSTKTYSVYVDNVALYEVSRTEQKTADVIWDIDFEEFSDGATLTEDQIKGLSDVAGVSSTGSWRTKGQIVTYNGSKAMKMSNSNSEYQLDLWAGNGMYDPLKNGTVRIAYDFTVESFNTSGGDFRLLRWRKTGTSTSTPTASANIVDMAKDGTIKFCGNATDVKLELNKTYRIEVIVNNQWVNGVNYADVTFKIDGNTIADSYPVWKDAEILGSNQFKGVPGSAEGYAYFVDDAGNKCYYPYTGFTKNYVYDADGNKISDGQDGYIYYSRLVKETTPNPDMFRMFQGAGGSDTGSVYYVDNLIIEKFDDQTFVDFGFDGWSDQDVATGNIKSLTDGRLNQNNATLETDDNGNSYMLLPNSSSQMAMSVGDKDMYFFAKDVLLNTDVYLPTKATKSFTATTFISLTVQTNLTDPYGWDNVNSTTKFTHLLYVDSEGKLYTESDKVNPIGQLTVGGWTNIQIFLDGDGVTWNEMSIYVDGVRIAVKSIYVSNAIKTYAVRYRAIDASYGIDNISLSIQPKPIVPLTMSFENTEQTEEMLGSLGGDWVYGTIGATRVDVDGATVKTTEILGDEEAKYLRVNHSRVKASTLSSFIDARESKFINKDTYLIETAIRYTAYTSYGLTVAEVYNSDNDKSAALLGVKGESNQLFVTLRGVSYNVVDKNQNLSVAKNITDNGFTKVAILVDDVNNTYTLYVDGKLAYYMYNDQMLPCLDLPMHFMDTTVEFNEDFIRLLEIPSVKYADSILDIDYVNFKSNNNGLAAEVKGSQTRVVLADAKFDVRFVAGLDTIYAEAVGYEIVAEYTEGGTNYTKNHDVSHNVVFEKIEAAGTDVTAASQDSAYLAAMEICSIPADIPVTFTVKPYVLRNDAKVYGEAYTAKFLDGKIIK